MQRLLGAFINTFQTKNVFGSMDSPSCVVSHIYIHRTHFLAFTARNTLVLIFFKFSRTALVAKIQCVSFKVPLPF